jgi:NADPH-dependent 2,4-dienoyl-CoA reductase/sulfur reductase-like enzyme/nitrite reductase/ring-hydroxylating ferredoxin subunit
MRVALEESVDESPKLEGPDFCAGVRLEDVPEGGVLLGHAEGEAVLLCRRGDDVHAIGATCSHYGGPLAEGLVDGDTIVCPWHHARFHLMTGEAVGAPALDAVPCWNTTRKGDLIVLGHKRDLVARAPAERAPASVVIVGAGAAGGVLSEELRRQGYAGTITLLGDSRSGPVDRPNLSKDYLAGKLPVERLPMRPPEYYAEQKIDLRVSSKVTAIDLVKQSVAIADGSAVSYETLVLATGAGPIMLEVPGAEAIMYLHTLADAVGIVGKAKGRRNAVVLGASFLGLEAAAALRTQGLEVDVVAPEGLPLARILGDELGAFVKKLHEEHGVRFHLGRKVALFDSWSVVLDNGETLAADIAVAGIGVRPRIELAEEAGIRCDRGVLVNDRLETSASGVYAIGDVARYPDPNSGELVRIEHWVVAERQAQALARTIVGRGEPYRDVPFFWSQHYDVPIAYVGHAEKWDRVHVKGSVDAKDCLVGFEAKGKILAVASIFRDRQSLLAEAALRRGDHEAVARLFD